MSEEDKTYRHMLEEKHVMPTILRTLVVCAATMSSAFALDNGPRIVGCDYKLGNFEGTDKCLIVGNGMNQGITWVVFEFKGKRFRYEDSDPDQIEIISKSGDTLASGHVTNSFSQCRPGGKDADIFTFNNGDRICLYWE